MPGMDGFEAVKAIKENPATATIPILMYTSKGGDLYLGQARALGAVGILPKTVAPAELFNTLLRLGLVEERRSDSEPEADQNADEVASERKEDLPRRPHPPAQPFLEPGMARTNSHLDAGQLDDHVRKLLEEQRVELRKDLLLSMESVARQTASKLNREVEEQLQQLNVEPVQRSQWPILTLILALLLLISLAWNWSLQHSPPADSTATVVAPPAPGQARAEDAEQKLELQLEHARQQLQYSQENLGWSINQSLQYAYDEIALDNQRVDIIEALLQRMANSGFSGKITLATHVGEFCLLGSLEEGFRWPPPELPVDQCEFIGNPVQPADLPAAHQSLRFANFYSSTPLLTEGGITLEVIALPREEALHDYPEKSDTTTARSWNEAASRNNRVLVSIEP
jgi:CheY-like chemotaxis protein